MEVPVGTLTKFCIIAILCNSACTLKVHMSNCNVAMDSNQCIAHNSTSDIHYKGDNVLATIIIRLPNSVLTELLSDPRKVWIVTAGGENVTFGEEILRKQDRATWTVQIQIQPVNREYGRLHLLLDILDVQYSDEQWLHMEIRTDKATFKTSDQIWFPVHRRATNDEETDHQPQGDSMITKNTSAAEDQTAKIEELQRENDALHQEITIAHKNSSHYQVKYFRCLETKNDLEEHERTLIVSNSPSSPDIITCSMFFIAFVIITAICIYIRSKLVVRTVDGAHNPEILTLQPGGIGIIKNGYLVPKSTLLGDREA